MMSFHEYYQFSDRSAKRWKEKEQTIYGESMHSKNRRTENEHGSWFTFIGIAFGLAIYHLEFFGRVGSQNLNSVCLSAYSILKSGKLLRLVFSPLFHSDKYHLYYNMVSFALKGHSLELQFGSVYFGTLLVVFTFCYSLTYVGIQYFSSIYYQEPYRIDECAVGFSGLPLSIKCL